jgi:type II secretory pathway component GspD/PulD (secretin)
VTEVYYLEHINSEAATTLVSELYTEILAGRTGQVTIRALVEPNAILLIGRKESLDIIKELIEKLDRPSPPASKFEIFRLKYVSSVDAETTVRNFFVNRPGTDTNPRSGLGVRVQIIADFRTNSLIVQASPRDMEEVRRLVESLDVADVEEGSAFELKVFKLKNALAETLATVIQSAISGQAATGQQQGGQAQQQVGAGRVRHPAPCN